MPHRRRRVQHEAKAVVAPPLSTDSEQQQRATQTPPSPIPAGHVISFVRHLTTHEWRKIAEEGSVGSPVSVTLGAAGVGCFSSAPDLGGWLVFASSLKLMTCVRLRSAECHRGLISDLEFVCL